MAKKGREYERFVYDKFRRLFVDSTVTLNDRVVGQQSGIEREIDVSIRTAVGADALLYIVQCKDRAKRPADIVILGEFSAVIKDVGAAKGFLICTSGFAKTNYQCARRLGIELLTVEDVNSDKWKADIQIPFVYVRKVINYRLEAEIIANEALVERNRNQDLTIQFDISSQITVDNGVTAAPIEEYVKTELEKLAPNASEAQAGVELDLLRPNLQVDIAGVWADCGELTVNLTIGKVVYLKYLTPDEYSHIRDHLRDTMVPLHVAVSGMFPILDDTFVEIAGGEVPIFPSIYLVVEEWTDMERAQGKVRD